VLILRGTLAQVSIGCLITIFALLLYTRLQPFVEPSTNLFGEMAQLCMLLTLFGGVLTVARDSTRSAYDADVVDVLVIVVNLLVPCIGVVLIVVKHAVLPWRELAQKHPQASRRSRFYALVGLPMTDRSCGGTCYDVCCRRIVSRRRRGNTTTSASCKDAETPDATGAIEMTDPARPSRGHRQSKRSDSSPTTRFLNPLAPSTVGGGISGTGTREAAQSKRAQRVTSMRRASTVISQSQQ